MPARRLWFVLLCCTALVSCQRPDFPDEYAPYDAKIQSRIGQTIRFADFELTFLGKHRVVPPQYPRGWDVYDFRVSRDGVDQNAAWSAGTGSIGPAEFTVGGRRYWLERAMADKLGRLEEDQIVVRRAP